MNDDCRRTRPLLDAYGTSELQADAMYLVDGHLAACASCRQALDDRRQWRAALNAAVRSFVPSPELAIQIRDAVRAQASSRPFVVGWWQIAAAVAALLLVGGWLQYRADADLILTRLGVGQGDHVFCARNGILPDAPVSPAAMRDKLGPAYAPLVDQLIAHTPGYLVREGHRCHWDGREFVHFILERDGHRASVVLTRKKDSEEVFPRHALLAAMRANGLPLYAAERDGLSIAGLESDGHLVFAVSERGSEESLRILSGVTVNLPGLMSP